MKYLIILVCIGCLLAITASAIDLRCGAVLPAVDTVIIACRAGRMP